WVGVEEVSVSVGVCCVAVVVGADSLSSPPHPDRTTTTRTRLSAPRKRMPTRIFGIGPELLFDAEELVVLGDPVAAAGRARLDLTGVRRDGEIGDRRVLGLAGAMRDHRRVAGRSCGGNRLERLGQRPDLVDLDQDGVRDAFVDAAPEPVDVRDEEVVADELLARAELLCEPLPRRPVVLGGAVLDRDDGVAGDPPPPVLREVLGGRLAAPDPVDAFFVQLRHRRVQRDPDPLSMARPLGRLKDDLDRLLARAEIWSKAALVADRGRETAVVE